MEQPLSLLEERLKAVINDTLRVSGGAEFPSDDLARQLVQEILGAARKAPAGEQYAPDQFTVSLQPAFVDRILEASPHVQSELSRRLRQVLEADNYHLARDPHVTLATDPTLPSGRVRLIAWHSSDPLSLNTEPSAQPAGGAQDIPQGAFLVVQGKKYFPLKSPSITIGRLMTNDLVLTDPHVSRSHARLDASEGKFMLSDLNSTGGTAVNGRLIHRCRLRPGDVISCAGVELIYGEGTGGRPEVTPPYIPPAPTATERDQVTPLDLRTLTGKRTRPYSGDPRLPREKHPKTDREPGEHEPHSGDSD
jgi:hypothetical protein